jgi:hypothetical protein
MNRQMTCGGDEMSPSASQNDTAAKHKEMDKILDNEEEISQAEVMLVHWNQPARYFTVVTKVKRDLVFNDA